GRVPEPGRRPVPQPGGGHPGAALRPLLVPPRPDRHAGPCRWRRARRHRPDLLVQGGRPPFRAAGLTRVGEEDAIGIVTGRGSTPMDEAPIIASITEPLGGVDVAHSSGNPFFFYAPGRDLPPDHRFPFATLVTNDSYDTASNLSRPSVFRLNVGVSKQTFRSLFGSPPVEGHDYTALDRIMPHPVYGKMYWVCVLN